MFSKFVYCNFLWILDIGVIYFFEGIFCVLNAKEYRLHVLYFFHKNEEEVTYLSHVI